MFVHTPEPFRLERPGKHQFHRMLMSDLHIGGQYTDLDRIRQDLDLAREFNARIALNGDIIDAITPKDVKRSDPEALSERGRGRRDVINAQVEEAADFLKPYVDLIDFIGCGNHETAIEKYHATDPLSILFHILKSETGYSVNMGGYEGYWQFRCIANERKYISAWIRYHHGGGGAAPVTKGMIEFNRMQSWICDADVIWVGHKHNRFVDSCSRERVNSHGRVEYRDTLCVMTGGYFDSRRIQTQDDYRKNGRKANWAADRGLAPQHKGGILLRFDVDTNYNGLPGELQIKALV